MYIQLTVWPKWVKPRIEKYASGTWALFFGVGKLTVKWR